MLRERLAEAQAATGEKDLELAEVRQLVAQRRAFHSRAMRQTQS